MTVYTHWNMLDHAGAYIKTAGLKNGKLVIATQACIPDSYAKTILHACEQAGFTCYRLVIPDGEGAKSLAQVDTIITQLLAWRITRHDALIAVGGGVVGDLIGFVAAIYLRGIAFIQVPTTLLAQVDAALGGKTGVNHACGKNLIGAFHQPLCVITAIETLTSLPERHIRSGLAEVVKYGMILDAAFFAYLETTASCLTAVTADTQAIWETIIKKSSAYKLAVVRSDEKEAGYRMILNFGHTIGHAIEATGNYHTYSHGEAIAIGMALETQLAVQLGYCDAAVYTQLCDLLVRLKLPIQNPYIMQADKLLAHIYLDKKVKNGQIRLVLPQRIGETSVYSVQDSVIHAFLSGPSV